MKPDCYIIEIQLTPETRAEIFMRVVQEPALPTPNEPDIYREPTVSEWQEINGRMRKLDRIDVKRTLWPVRDARMRAEAIATDILTSFGGPECHRVQLMEKMPDGSERERGGRIKSSLIETIQAHL